LSTVIRCSFYKGLDIGTAKVPESPTSRRFPHHLVDIIEPTQIFTAGEYAEAGANQFLREIATHANRIPVVVGGTGFLLCGPLLQGACSPGPPRDACAVVRGALWSQGRRPDREVCTGFFSRLESGIGSSHPTPTIRTSSSAHLRFGCSRANRFQTMFELGGAIR